MKYNILLILIIGFLGTSFAQVNTLSKTEDSDPAAKVVLDKLKLKYEGFKSLEADFTLVVELPEEDKIEQQGIMAQEGDKFRLELDGQSIISDGTTLWVHLPQNKEVQINDAEDFGSEGDILRPQDILQKYESGDYVYILADEYMKGKTIIQQIEFKPVNSDDEDFFKLRLLVDKKQNAIQEMKAFSRDGSRYTLKMGQLEGNKTFTEDYFTFDVSKYPDTNVEDLRM